MAAPVLAIERVAPARGEHCDAPVDLMPPLVAMLAELIEECRRVAAGDDCYESASRAQGKKAPSGLPGW
ncbi:MAG: hypothetical protein ACREHD_33540 [Pirellulales bacterium]